MIVTTNGLDCLDFYKRNENMASLREFLLNNGYTFNSIYFKHGKRNIHHFLIKLNKKEEFKLILEIYGKFNIKSAIILDKNNKCFFFSKKTRFKPIGQLRKTTNEDRTFFELCKSGKNYYKIQK